MSGPTVSDPTPGRATSLILLREWLVWPVLSVDYQAKCDPERMSGRGAARP